jgi:hypothetical protein
MVFVSFFWDGKGDRWGSIERNRAMQNKRQAAQLRHRQAFRPSSARTAAQQKSRGTGRMNFLTYKKRPLVF